MIPMKDSERLIAAWHMLNSAKNTIPASGNVSVGPALHNIELAQDELETRIEMSQDKEAGNDPFSG